MSYADEEGAAPVDDHYDEPVRAKDEQDEQEFYQELIPILKECVKMVRDLAHADWGFAPQPEQHE